MNIRPFDSSLAWMLRQTIASFILSFAYWILFHIFNSNNVVTNLSVSGFSNYYNTFLEVWLLVIGCGYYEAS